jgi:hypothetical protein
MVLQAQKNNAYAGFPKTIVFTTKPFIDTIHSLKVRLGSKDENAIENATLFKSRIQIPLGSCGINKNLFFIQD